MIEIIILLLLGIALGFLLKSKKTFLKISDKLTTYSIYLLLFLLGLSVGYKEKIISNIKTIGLNASIITIGAIMGSVILSALTYKYFFNIKSHNEK